jgi:hypothetical protein
MPGLEEAVDLLRQVWQDPYRRGAVVGAFHVSVLMENPGIHAEQSNG